jgi:hypothetical protein
MPGYSISQQLYCCSTWIIPSRHMYNPGNETCFFAFHTCADRLRATSRQPDSHPSRNVAPLRHANAQRHARAAGWPGRFFLRLRSHLPHRSCTKSNQATRFGSIALQFRVTVDLLVAANPDVSPNSMSIGTEAQDPQRPGQPHRRSDLDARTCSR